MSNKLNPKTGEDTRFDKTAKLPGGMNPAVQSNLQALRRITLACLLWEKNFYTDGISTSAEMQRLIPLCDPHDVAALAIECREQQKLRHTPLFMIVEMCKHPNHCKLVAEVIYRVCTRPDMITDLVALYWKDGKKSLPNQMKKGLAKAFTRFNEYSLAKYNRPKSVKLRDVMFLVHAKPEQGKEELYKKLADNTLETPETWEVLLSASGNKPKIWEKLINEGKIGGLAMLRNLANMKKAGVEIGVINLGLKTLKSTMLLPLDYLKAARMAPEFERQIENAMIESYKNLPKLPGNTLFIVDVSGSMNTLTSGNSTFSRLDQACAMAMLATMQCEKYTLVSTAGDDSRGVGAHMHIAYPTIGFKLADQIVSTKATIGGGGIFTRQCLEWCKEKFGESFDRIIIFSDSQDCDKENKIPKPFAKYNYIVDVSAEKHGVNYRNVWTAEISGWSENFLTFIASMEGLENKFDQQEQ